MPSLSTETLLINDFEHLLTASNRRKQRLTRKSLKNDENNSVTQVELRLSETSEKSKTTSPVTQDDSELKKRTLREKSLPRKRCKTFPSKWDPNIEYEVEGIRDVRMSNNKTLEFLIKWKDWPEYTNSWEPLENLNCFFLIVKFLSKKKDVEESMKAETMSYYVKHLDSEEDELNIVTINKLLGLEMSTIKRAKVSNATRSVLRHKVRNLDENILLDNIRTSFGSEILFVEWIERQKQFQKNLSKYAESAAKALSEELPIYFENFVDEELPPSDFKFIKDYVYARGVHLELAEVGCSCKECGDESCQLIHNVNEDHNGVAIGNYTPDGKLAKWARDTCGPIFECNSACKCSIDCPNRVTQRGRPVPLTVFRTDDDRGWGVRTNKQIDAWTFVSYYLGRVVRSQDASDDLTYQFDLDFNDAKESRYVVDAQDYGNASHFINHSCNPNLVVVTVWIDNLDTYMPRLAFFACRHIKNHEELTFDYRLNSNVFAGGLKCLCGESNCRGNL